MLTWRQAPDLNNECYLFGNQGVSIHNVDLSSVEFVCISLDSNVNLRKSKLRL